MSRSDLFNVETRTQILRRSTFVFGLWLLSIFLFNSLSHAQVPASKPITPSGLNTAVSDPITIGTQTQYNITGGTRPGGGTNIFHSFGNFNVPTNNIANFLNDSGLPTSNILGRVTGGNISNIFGTIQTNGPGGFGNANLFLVNPAGFLFGPNATVNVGGMVAFTSADYLRLEGIGGNGIFHADPSKASVLTSAPVAAFGFLGSDPGAITVQGSQLSVTPGQSISLVGGNISMQSGTLENGMVQNAILSAPGGRVNLASVASPGEVLAETLNFAPNINGQTFVALGSIEIAQHSMIDVSGNDGGTVLIRGGRFLLDESTIMNDVLGPTGGPPGSGIDIVVSHDATIQNGALLENSVIGEAQPGTQYGGIHVKADRIEIIGSQDAVNFPLTGVSSTVTPESSVNGGNILLEANSILVKDFGLGTTIVETTTLGSGNAGKISLNATNNLEVDQGVIDSFAVFGSGHAGDIKLSSAQGNIVMKNAAFVSSQTSPFSSGNSGAILLDAPSGDISLADMTQISNAVRGAGELKGIEVNAKNLTLANSGIAGDNVFSPQAPENININLSGTLSLGGTSFQSFITTIARGSAPAADLNVKANTVLITDGARLSTESFSTGPGGQLKIVAQDLQLTNGGQIRSGSTFLPLDQRVGPPEVPSGNGGTITVNGPANPANSVLVDGAGSGFFTNAEGTGAGGNMVINANSVTLQNGGTLSAATSGTSPSSTGGSINVTATNGVTMNSGGSITASSTGPANAGNIFLSAGPQLVMQDSSIKTEAAQAGGGNIEIQAGNLVQLGNSTVSTSVLGGSGSGGNITIDPNAVILQNSQILAQAVQGSGGNINITTNLLLPDTASIISASSQFGQQGNIVIQSPVSPASGKIIPLGQKPLIVTTLLGQRCAALAGGNVSSFTVAGRDALPSEPGALVSTPLPLQLAELSDDGAKESISTNTTDAGEATPLLSLRRIAPPGFLTQSFATDVAGCAS